ncbi:uncharacterized protein BCR38DRAFT_433435 [Pseudomassariella vexata]|uniref:Uncharacterized protein n=1 Tax=Pseudomassariella vexata TaxID=1141098 RepID=A0A1Y2DX85_9PEZI|nr:uncharacterized protein BCR38DRAFT_433435 [Pseudomassariella vexata]ORY63910.1 hypothetical protein BCR38DRAFT_433435 [Pseudomassariella vexata]
MPAEEACHLLASCAREISKVVFRVIRPYQKRVSVSHIRVAAEIGTQLHLFHSYVDSLPPYWIDHDIEQLCKRVLEELVTICTWPQPSKALPGVHVQQCFLTLLHLLQESRQRKIEASINEFFTGQQNYRLIEAFNDLCLELYHKLVKSGDDDDGDANFPPEEFENNGPKIQPTFTKEVFNVLQRHMECEPSLHEASGGISLAKPQRHPVRLSLSEDADDVASFEFFISNWDMKIWQQIRFEIHTSKRPESHHFHQSKLLHPGAICTLWEKQFSSAFLWVDSRLGLYQLRGSNIPYRTQLSGPGQRLSYVLRNYTLTPKDTVILAYAIARAYWQAYNSELMRTRWTSDTIWFLPEEQNSRPSNELPLRAYLALPFGIPDDPAHDTLEHDLLNHKFPRIFAIGVILLQIGRGEPFCTPKRSDGITQANQDHWIASRELRRLQDTKWKGFSSKKVFDRAVEYCLDSGNFVSQSSQPHCPPIDATNSADTQKGLRIRMKAFYRHVVLPLHWMAKKGFGNYTQEVQYIREKATNTPPTEEPHLRQGQLQALFHSGKSVTSRKWLQDMNLISADVERKRRQRGLRNPIRVAIIDTGLNPDLPFFRENDSRRQSITYRKDFVDPGASSTLSDSFGHGTLMVRLIMECAPMAEIIVARVSRSTKDLQKNKSKISEAILWAGLECQADIVSMSFGLAQDENSISRAIQKVQEDRHRAAIFLSSAGNSPGEEESFLARHPSVISIFAANCYGTFSEANAIQPRDGPVVLGTFGDDLPMNIPDEFREQYPKSEVCQPGSSIATAVAAGISATMLAYADVLVDMHSDQISKRVFQRLRESKGMEALLHKMAQEKPHRRRFVNPIAFWSGKPNDWSRYSAIADCMWDYDKKYP